MVIGSNGKIAMVGLNLDTPQGATVVQANLAWLTPGLFDLHSHAGVYSFPGDAVATQDGTGLEPSFFPFWLLLFSHDIRICFFRPPFLRFAPCPR